MLHYEQVDNSLFLFSLALGLAGRAHIVSSVKVNMKYCLRLTTLKETGSVIN
jgi:hypothetical protein